MVKFSDLKVTAFCSREEYKKIADALRSWERIAKFFSGKYSKSIRVTSERFFSCMSTFVDDNMDANTDQLVAELFYYSDQRLEDNDKPRLKMGRFMIAAEKFQEDFPDCKLLEEIKSFEDRFEEQETPYGSEGEGEDEDEMVVDLGKMIDLFVVGATTAKEKQSSTKKGKKSKRKN
jgi:hypothetical protein